MTERKSEQIKQLLVRFIRDTGMKRGERLPSQDFFRRRFSCGTATVTAAINDLKADGVLEVRDKVGVFVVDPNADGHAGRVIGLTTRHATGSPYYSCLLWALQEELLAAGCMIRLFACRNDHEDAFDFELADFPGLRRCIENHELDGLIHLDDLRADALILLRKQQIPTLFTGSIGVSPDGIFYDQRRMIREMAACRPDRNCRSALFLPKSIRQYLEADFRAFAGDDAIVTGGHVIADGTAFADRLLELPPAERPGCIFFLDDLLALAALARLAAGLGPERMPRAVVLRNLQLQLSFPVRDAIYFDIDLTGFAARAAELLLAAMKKGDPAIGRHFFAIPRSNA